MKRFCQSPIVAGATYFLIVFLVAFALGVVRTSWLVPTIGAGPALAIELPLILALSWHVCRGLVGRFGIGPEAGPRLLMGATAFALLTAAELLLSVVVIGQSPGDFLRGYATWLGAAGGLAQLVFAVFPLLQRKSLGDAGAS